MEVIKENQSDLNAMFANFMSNQLAAKFNAIPLQQFQVPSVNPKELSATILDISKRMLAGEIEQGRAFSDDHNETGAPGTSRRQQEVSNLNLPGSVGGGVDITLKSALQNPNQSQAHNTSAAAVAAIVSNGFLSSQHLSDDNCAGEQVKSDSDMSSSAERSYTLGQHVEVEDYEIDDDQEFRTGRASNVSRKGKFSLFNKK